LVDFQKQEFFSYTSSELLKLVLERGESLHEDARTLSANVDTGVLLQVLKRRELLFGTRAFSPHRTRLTF
jgi:hypothetical protein